MIEYFTVSLQISNQTNDKAKRDALTKRSHQIQYHDHLTNAQKMILMNNWYIHTNRVTKTLRQPVIISCFWIRKNPRSPGYALHFHPGIRGFSCFQNPVWFWSAKSPKPRLILLNLFSYASGMVFSIGFPFARSSISFSGLPAVKERRMEILVSGIDDSEIGVGCQFVYDAIEYSKDQIYSSCNNQWESTVAHTDKDENLGYHWPGST